MQVHFQAKPRRHSFMFSFGLHSQCSFYLNLQMPLFVFFYPGSAGTMGFWYFCLQNVWITFLYYIHFALRLYSLWECVFVCLCCCTDWTPNKWRYVITIFCYYLLHKHHTMQQISISFSRLQSLHMHIDRNFHIKRQATCYDTPIFTFIRNELLLKLHSLNSWINCT